MLLDKKFGEIMRQQQEKGGYTIPNTTMRVATILSVCIANEISTMEECVNKIKTGLSPWEL